VLGLLLGAVGASRSTLPLATRRLFALALGSAATFVALHGFRMWTGNPWTRYDAWAGQIVPPAAALFGALTAALVGHLVLRQITPLAVQHPSSSRAAGRVVIAGMLGALSLLPPIALAVVLTGGHGLDWLPAVVLAAVLIAAMALLLRMPPPDELETGGGAVL